MVGLLVDGGQPEGLTKGMGVDADHGQIPGDLEAQVPRCENGAGRHFVRRPIIDLRDVIRLARLFREDSGGERAAVQLAHIHNQGAVAVFDVATGALAVASCG